MLSRVALALCALVWGATASSPVLRSLPPFSQVKLPGCMPFSVRIAEGAYGVSLSGFSVSFCPRTLCHQPEPTTLAPSQHVLPRRHALPPRVDSHTHAGARGAPQPCRGRVCKRFGHMLRPRPAVSPPPFARRLTRAPQSSQQAAVSTEVHGSTLVLQVTKSMTASGVSILVTLPAGLLSRRVAAGLLAGAAALRVVPLR